VNRTILAFTFRLKTQNWHLIDLAVFVYYQVNGQKMNGKSQAEAVNILRSTRGLVTLLVQREDVMQSPRTPAVEVSLEILSVVINIKKY